MTTIVNTPASAPASSNSDSGMGAVVAVILLLIVGFLFFVYGLPMMKRAATPAQVNVPEQIDVNVNTPNGNSQ